MTGLVWDKDGERLYETGVEKVTLYLPDSNGDYTNAYAWNGVSSVSESPSGGEANAIYADNIKYLELISREEIGGSIEAYTYPEEFAECDGTNIVNGLNVKQQPRKRFGLSYVTKIGNDLEGDSYGETTHLFWNALASPSERQYSTINESPEALTFSWSFTTTPVKISGLTNPVSYMSFSSENQSAYNHMRVILEGDNSNDPSLPSPSDVYDLFNNLTPVVEVIPPVPVQNPVDTLTIPNYNTSQLTYHNITDGNAILAPNDTVTLTSDPTQIRAVPKPFFVVKPGYDNQWTFIND